MRGRPELCKNIRAGPDFIRLQVRGVVRGAPVHNVRFQGIPTSQGFFKIISILLHGIYNAFENLDVAIPGNSRYVVCCYGHFEETFVKIFRDFG